MAAFVTDDRLLTIDELAQEVGMTTRNIRAHQTRGLVPAPVLEGRVGRYGPAHVERLRLIKRLQDQGLNLQAISMVLGERSEDELVRVRKAVLEPFATEDPVVERVVDVNRRLGDQVDADVLRRSVAAGIVSPVPDDPELVQVNLPAVIRSAEAMLQLGVPVAPQTATVEEVDAHVRAVARAFVGLARDHLVAELVDDAGDPAALRERVEQLRQIAADVLLTLFHRAMTEEAESLVSEVLPPER